MILNKDLILDLKNKVKAFIDTHPDGFKEYDLMKHLEEHIPVFQDLTDSSELSLFKKHFLIKNTLYNLQPFYLEERRKLLHVAATRIYLTPHSTNPDERSISSGNSDHELKSYYLDWNNFTDMKQECVEELLDSFWIRYYALDKRQDALGHLGLDATATSQEIKTQYKALAARHHPDKGGDAETFIKIRAAYEVLKA